MASKSKTASKPTLKVKKIWDNNGLLSSGVDYEFNESGHVDWKSMVLKKTDLLMPNRSWFFGREPEAPKNVADMENPKEEQLALTLRATQWLLNSRGYTNIEYNPICRISEGDKDIAVYSCNITFKRWAMWHPMGIPRRILAKNFPSTLPLKNFGLKRATENFLAL